MNYKIIATGSAGNALLLDNSILIECGVSFKDLRPYVKDIDVVFLSHIHQDHFKKSTVKTLAALRPSIRWAIPEYLLDDLLKCGVKPDKIDVLELETVYSCGYFKVETFELFHDVPNIGWKMFISRKSVFIATDTCRIDHLEAPQFDYYFIEANYTEDDIEERIRAKEASGEYTYEYRTMHTHLSKEKADRFLWENAGNNSVIEYMHGHKE